MSHVQNDDDTLQSNGFFCKEGDNNGMYNNQQESHSIDTQNLDQPPSISPEPHVDEMKSSIDENSNKLSSQDNGKIENEDSLLKDGFKKIEFESPLSVATAAATTTTPSNEKEESSSKDKEDVGSMEMDGALAQLVSMGFEISIARVALKENEGRDFDTVVHWLLQQKDDEKQKSKVKLSPPKPKLVPHRRPISAAGAQPPKKGILKTTPQPNTRPLWKRDWLSTLNTRIQNVTNVASTSPTTTSFLMTAFKRLNAPYSPQEEQPPKPSSPLQINTTLPADQISQQSSSLVNSCLLSQKSLKRVRFSVAKLTDEYPHSPIPSDSDGSDWEDEYDFREWNEKQKRNSPSHPESEQKVYSAKEIEKYYLAACRHREEFPLDRLVTIFKRASQPGGSFKIIDLTGDIIDRRIAEPMADVLTLECGLRKLILERCEIEDDTLKILCHSLLVNDTLSYLSLSNNKRLRSNGFNYIALYIKKSKSLTYLDLSGTNIDKKSVTFLAQALVQGSNRSGSILETLKLDGCGLKNNGLEVLGPGVRRSNLKYLSLRYNRINNVGAVWIGVMLRDYDDLHLEQTNSILSEFDEYEEDKAEKLQRRHGLEVFDARGNEIKSGIQYIAQSLRRNRSLRELYLPNNRMDPNCLVYMADGLRHNKSLEVLDMSKNPVGGPSIEGVIALRDALSHNKTLKGFFLSDTQLGTEGAIAIAEYLPETRSLVHLDLTSNPEIDIAGIMALAVSIKMNHSIRILDVNVRPNDAEAAQFSRDILRACVRNTELSHKDLESSNSSSLPDNRHPTEIPHLDYVKKDMNLAEECLKVFGAMLSNEESNLDKVENNEVIEQLRSQCQDLQSKIRLHIASVANEKLLEDLLALNDNLSLALQKHANIYTNQLSPSSSEPESTRLEQNGLSSTTEPVTASDGINDLTVLDPEQKLSITIPQQPEPFSEFLPTFSIGDSDEEIEGISDTLHSEGKSAVSQLKLPGDVPESQDRRSSMEEMNKLLVLEEGEVLKKSKSILDEQDSAKIDPNETEGNMKEQKLEVLEETSSSGDIRNKILATADT